MFSRTFPTARAHVVNDGAYDRLQRRIAALLGPGDCPRPLALAELAPHQPPHHIIIFSIGITRIAEAPASLSFWRVSQKTDSLHTACTAKWPWRPASGIIVGASAPGRIDAILSRASSGALSMMYFDSCVASTPSIRRSRRSAMSAFSLVSGLVERISTASLSSTVSTGRRPL